MKLISITELSSADERLSRLCDREVRIVYLPPMQMLSFHSVGEAPELDSDAAVQEFLKASDFAKLNPGVRHFGFNHDVGGVHGYERRLTLSEGMSIPKALLNDSIKIKAFPGGLYAVTCAMMGEWDRWNLLMQYFDKHERYEVCMNDSTQMGGLLEEHLNYLNWYEDPALSMEENDRTKQLDLYLPVKRK